MLMSRLVIASLGYANCWLVEGQDEVEEHRAGRNAEGAERLKSIVVRARCWRIRKGHQAA